jgi:hypothetical protein
MVVFTLRKKDPAVHDLSLEEGKKRSNLEAKNEGLDHPTPPFLNPNLDSTS